MSRRNQWSSKNEDVTERRLNAAARQWAKDVAEIADALERATARWNLGLDGQAWGLPLAKYVMRNAAELRVVAGQIERDCRV